jgi:hypothetical protein
MNQLEIKHIIEEINNISYTHQDLMALALEYNDEYLVKESDKRLYKYLEHPAVLQQAILSVREGLVLGIQANILDESVPFEDIIDGCINKEMQNYHLSEVKLNVVNKQELITYYKNIRKFFFNKVVEEMTELKEITELNSNLIAQRLELFIKKC